MDIVPPIVDYVSLISSVLKSVYYNKCVHNVENNK